jgi:hypothetical protein
MGVVVALAQLQPNDTTSIVNFINKAIPATTTQASTLRLTLDRATFALLDHLASTVPFWLVTFQRGQPTPGSQTLTDMPKVPPPLAVTLKGRRASNAPLPFILYLGDRIFLGRPLDSFQVPAALPQPVHPITLPPNPDELIGPLLAGTLRPAIPPPALSEADHQLALLAGCPGDHNCAAALSNKAPHLVLQHVLHHHPDVPWERHAKIAVSLGKFQSLCCWGSITPGGFCKLVVPKGDNSSFCTLHRNPLYYDPGPAPAPAPAPGAQGGQATHQDPPVPAFPVQEPPPPAHPATVPLADTSLLQTIRSSLPSVTRNPDGTHCFTLPGSSVSMTWNDLHARCAGQRLTKSFLWHPRFYAVTSALLRLVHEGVPGASFALGILHLTLPRARFKDNSNSDDEPSRSLNLRRYMHRLLLAEQGLWLHLIDTVPLPRQHDQATLLVQDAGLAEVHMDTLSATVAKRVASLLAQGNVGAASRAIGASGLAYLTKEEMQGFFPAAAPGWPPPPPVPPDPETAGGDPDSVVPLAFTTATLTKALREVNFHAAAGVDGLSFAFLRNGVIDQGNQPFTDTLIVFLNQCLEGSLLPEAHELILQGRLIPLAKEGGGARPIVVGSALRRVLALFAISTIQELLVTDLGSEQYGSGVKLGTEKAINALRLFLSHHANLKDGGDFIVAQLDAKSAFNYADRSVMERNWRRLSRPVHLLFMLLYGQSSPITTSQGTIFCYTGAQQGCSFGSPSYCFIVKDMLAEIRQTITDPFEVIAFIDDINVLGPASTVRKVVLAIREIGPKYGYNLNPAKSCFLRPNLTAAVNAADDNSFFSELLGVDAQGRPVKPKGATSWHANGHWVLPQGGSLLGAQVFPISGLSADSEQSLSTTANKSLAQFRARLLEVSLLPDLQSRMLILRTSANTSLVNHLLRNVPPWQLPPTFLTDLEAALVTAIRSCYVPPGLLTTRPTPRELTRFFLPIRQGGLGFISPLDVGSFAHAASLIATAPSLITFADRCHLNANPHLAVSSELCQGAISSRKHQYAIDSSAQPEPIRLFRTVDGLLVPPEKPASQKTMLRNMTSARRSQLLHWLRTERAPWVHDRVPTAQACRVAVASYLTTSMSFLTSIPGFNDNEMTMSPAIFSAAVAWGLDVAKIYVSPGIEVCSVPGCELLIDLHSPDSCRLTGRAQLRHNFTTPYLAKLANDSGMFHSVTTEPSNRHLRLSPDAPASQKRPADVYVVPRYGPGLFYDHTFIGPAQQSVAKAGAITCADDLLVLPAEAKRAKYAELLDAMGPGAYEFHPLVFSTKGLAHSETMRCLRFLAGPRSSRASASSLSSTLRQINILTYTMAATFFHGQTLCVGAHSAKADFHLINSKLAMQSSVPGAAPSSVT